MAIPLIWWGLGALAAGAAYKKHKSKKMSAEHELIFKNALQSLKDPAKLKELADAFEKEGLHDAAQLLRKRAILRELPPELKKARREALRKGLSSNDPKEVNELADAFEKEGATGAANDLRAYAKALTTVAKS